VLSGLSGNGCFSRCRLLAFFKKLLFRLLKTLCRFPKKFGMIAWFPRSVGCGNAFSVQERNDEMQTAKQLSVSLVNKPGRLVDMLAALSKCKVGLRALAVMDSGERGVVRFVPDDAVLAMSVLEELNARYDISDVLLVDVPSQAGCFRKICERLATEHLNIDYAYCSFDGEGRARGGGIAVIKVNNLAKAQRVLAENSPTARKKMSLYRRPVLAR
jgi:hypothetical protein